MRYYDIRIIDPPSGKLVRQFTSLAPLGYTLPGALNVDLDVPTYALAAPAGAAYVRIWGISIKEISQASDYNTKTLQVYAGMAKGLPLANPAQRGLILEGEISQAYGNWQGVNMSLDLIVQAAVGSQDAPANIILNWKAGTPLSTALQSTLSTAFPDFTITGLDTINPNLVQSNDDVMAFQTASQLANYIKGRTQTIINTPNYQGVEIFIQQKQFNIFDGSSTRVAKIIEFKDLIGQPSWIGPQQIQFKTVMRANIVGGDLVELPKGQVTTTAQSYSQFRDQSQFTGNYTIIAARHVGCYRQADGNSWVTVFDATPELRP